MNNHPKTPTKNIINLYLKKDKTLENYALQEKSLNLLFNDLCPKNTIIEHILLKVSTLNDFYSTNIYDTYSIAKNILKKDIDIKLKNGDTALIDLIASGHNIRNKKSKKEIYFYSFASKYCSHHRPEMYPIYDSYVEKMLVYFQKRDKFHTFKKDELKNYNIFLQIVKAFREFYDLKGFSLREIDIYLWLAGKEYFPNKYSKHKI